MNAPHHPVPVAADCGAGPCAPVDLAEIRPESVRFSSRSLGWGPLNIERREIEPSAQWFPAGTTEHLIFINLAEGHCVREGVNEISDHAIEAGHVSIHPSEKPVRWQWDTRLSFIMLALEPAFLDRVAERVFELDPSTLELQAVERQRDPVITHIAGVLSREALAGDAGSRLLAESLANQLGVHLIRHYTNGSPELVAEPPVLPPRAVTRAIDFINLNYAHDISLSEIAESAHLSPFHVARLFKRTTGLSPHQYLVQVRVNSARSLLTAGAGARSLAEIALAVGFADQSHLTRHFKRVLGVTPKQMKQ